ncbi:MAG: hypothetical protein KAV87_47465, partial [Desulfobacteraceae bacterium]|nr:hypothetical protein [Desulfobacteraceae bacterium]
MSEDRVLVVHRKGKKRLTDELSWLDADSTLRGPQKRNKEGFLWTSNWMDEPQDIGVDSVALKVKLAATVRN